MPLSFWVDALVRVVAALWAGAVFAFAAWFAPHAFRALPTRRDAASFTRPVRERLERFGAYASLAIVLLLYWLGARDGWWTMSRVRMAVASAAALSWLAHVWIVRPLIDRRFSRPLHELSRGLYALALLGALLVAAL